MYCPFSPTGLLSGAKLPVLRLFALIGQKSGLFAANQVKCGRASGHLDPHGCAKCHVNRCSWWECGPQNHTKSFIFSRVKNPPPKKSRWKCLCTQSHIHSWQIWRKFHCSGLWQRMQMCTYRCDFHNVSRNIKFQLYIVLHADWSGEQRSVVTAVYIWTVFGFIQAKKHTATRKIHKETKTRQRRRPRTYYAAEHGGGTGVSGLTKGLAMLPSRWIQ